MKKKIIPISFSELEPIQFPAGIPVAVLRRKKSPPMTSPAPQPWALAARKHPVPARARLDRPAFLERALPEPRFAGLSGSRSTGSSRGARGSRAHFDFPGIYEGKSPFGG